MTDFLVGSSLLSVIIIFVCYMFFCLVFGIALLVACFQLGPFDLYNTICYECIGEMPLAKQRIIEYCQASIKNNNPDLTLEQIDKQIADELGIKLIAEKHINPQNISSVQLWDLAEDHAQTWKERWIAIPILHTIEKEYINQEEVR